MSKAGMKKAVQLPVRGVRTATPNPYPKEIG
jgi:hypothetical protein